MGSHTAAPQPRCLPPCSRFPPYRWHRTNQKSLLRGARASQSQGLLYWNVGCDGGLRRSHELRKAVFISNLFPSLLRISLFFQSSPIFETSFLSLRKSCY